MCVVSISSLKPRMVSLNFLWHSLFNHYHLCFYCLLKHYLAFTVLKNLTGPNIYWILVYHEVYTYTVLEIWDVYIDPGWSLQILIMRHNNLFIFCDMAIQFQHVSSNCNCTEEIQRTMTFWNLSKYWGYMHQMQNSEL